MASRNYSRQRLVREALLGSDDLARVAKCRKPATRLGFAYQMGFVRLFNRFPTQQPLEIDEELLGYIAMQLNLSPEEIETYASRQATVSEHQNSIREFLGLRNFTEEQSAKDLEQFIFEEACRLEQTSALEARAKEFLKEQKTLLPADYALKELIAKQRKLVRERIQRQVMEQISPKLAKTLDGLMEVAPNQSVSALQRIKENPKKPSPEAMISLMGKLDKIEATGALKLDLSWLNSNYQRTLFHYVRKCTVHRLREVAEQRRYSALMCFLHHSYRDAIDQAIDMFDKILNAVVRRSEDDLDEHLKSQRKSIRESLGTLQSMGEIILDESIGDEDLREKIFEAVSRKQLAEQITSLEEWVTGKKSNVFPL